MDNGSEFKISKQHSTLIIELKTEQWPPSGDFVTRVVQIPAKTSVRYLLDMISAIFEISISKLAYIKRFVPRYPDSVASPIVNDNTEPGYLWDAESAPPTSIASLFFEENDVKQIALTFNMSEYADIVMTLIRSEEKVGKIGILEAKNAISTERVSDLNEIRDILLNV